MLPNQNISYCFQDPKCQGGNISACGNYCDITSDKCKSLIFPYCSGSDTTSAAQWLDRWTNNSNCEYAIQRNIFTIPSNSCSLGYSQLGLSCNSPVKQTFTLNADGVSWTSNLMYQILQTYVKYGFTLGANPGSSGYNNLQNTFYRICCDFPIVCQQALQNYCQQYTSNDLDNNLFAAQFCGCNLPITQYSTYSNTYNIEPYCTPYCNRSNAIPAVDAKGKPFVCKQNICIIDNTTYNLINSQINGSINITQICGNVGSGTGAQYSCIIDGNTFSVINSTLQNSDIVISEACQSTQCIITNPGLTGPSKITVPCGNTNENPYQQYDTQLKENQQLSKNISLILNIIIILVVFTIIFMILFFYKP